MATTQTQKSALNGKRAITFSNLKTRGLTLFIEHLPCCLLSFGAAFLGLPLVFQHNPWLEFGFALGGALVGENIGHRFFHNHSHCGAHAHAKAWQKRYAVAIVIGLLSWGLHQAIFHHPPSEQSAHTTHASHVTP